MKFSKLRNRSQFIFVLLVIFSIFVGLSCISATDVDKSISSVGDVNNLNLEKSPIDSAIDNISEDSSDSGIIVDENNDFTMSVRYTAGTGYHWEVSPESYGVDINSIDYKVDNPKAFGSPGTTFFNFHVNGESYYVKLVLISPSGEIVDEVDSNMVN